MNNLTYLEKFYLREAKSKVAEMKDSPKGDEKLIRQVNELLEQVFVFFDKEGKKISYQKYMFLALQPSYKIIAVSDGGGDCNTIFTTWAGVVLKRKENEGRFFHSEVVHDRTRYQLCHSRDLHSAMSFHSSLVKRSFERDEDGSMLLSGLDYTIQEIYRDEVPMMQDIDKKFKASKVDQMEIKFKK